MLSVKAILKVRRFLDQYLLGVDEMDIAVCVHCQKGAEEGHLSRVNDPDHVAPIWLHDKCVAAYEKVDYCACPECVKAVLRHYDKDKYITNPNE